MLFDEASSILSEESLQIKCLIELEKDSERGMARIVESERVVRMRSFWATMVARYLPSGLGRECADARLGLDCVRLENGLCEHTFQRS